MIDTPFPPDDRSFGWERGTTVSRMGRGHHRRRHRGGRPCWGPERPGRRAGGGQGPPGQAPRFGARFAERAFRRPLSGDERGSLYRSPVRFDPRRRSRPQAASSCSSSSRRGSSSPRPRARRASTRSRRLALVLWDSAPDGELLSAAAADKLGTKVEVAKHAERMLADPRGGSSSASSSWRGSRSISRRTWPKTRRFPEFNAALANDLRTSLELFLDDVLWSDSSDFRQLLLSDEIHLNGWLAASAALARPRSPPHLHSDGSGPARRKSRMHPSPR